MDDINKNEQNTCDSPVDILPNLNLHFKTDTIYNYTPETSNSLI